MTTLAKNKRRHTQPKNKPQTALRRAAKQLRRAVETAESGGDALAALDAEHERTLDELNQVDNAMNRANALDREPLAARGRKLRDSVEPLRLGSVDARRNQRSLDSDIQGAAATVAVELSKLARQRYDAAVQNAAEALLPWCAPATATRLAGSTDVANMLRAEMARSRFTPDAAAGRQLLGEAEQALRGHE